MYATNYQTRMDTQVRRLLLLMTQRLCAHWLHLAATAALAVACMRGATATCVGAMSRARHSLARSAKRRLNAHGMDGSAPSHCLRARAPGLCCRLAALPLLHHLAPCCLAASLPCAPLLPGLCALLPAEAARHDALDGVPQVPGAAGRWGDTGPAAAPPPAANTQAAQQSFLSAVMHLIARARIAPAAQPPHLLPPHLLLPARPPARLPPPARPPSARVPARLPQASTQSSRSRATAATTRRTRS